MQSILIILRGNSGSGKSTIANALQQHFGSGTLLIDQDVVRRNMLAVKDRPGNLSIELIRQIALYGNRKCEVVIVEGILIAEGYGAMLREVIEAYENRAAVYYFDLPFEETVSRHETREKRYRFGEDSLKLWWNPKDFLKVGNERAITETMTKEQIVQTIIQDVEQLKKEIQATY
jgi:shikimate kinase